MEGDIQTSDTDNYRTSSRAQRSLERRQRRPILGPIRCPLADNDALERQDLHRDAVDVGVRGGLSHWVFPGCRSTQRSTSCVLTGAPCSTAAPRPTTMCRTPRRLNATSSARSADVSAKSSTSQSRDEPFGWGQLQAAQCVVEIGDIAVRVCLCNRTGTTPERLGMLGPPRLIRCKSVLRPPRIRGGIRVMGH